jgi:hypothetical protein
VTCAQPYTPARYAATPADTGTRLGVALLSYMLGVTLIVTLLPFHFEWPREWRIIFTGDPLEVVANVLLFVPLGFLYRLARPSARGHPALAALVLGALWSLGIEAAQLFETARSSSALDVAANAAGAALGAAAYARIARAARADGRALGWLALELPLMGLVYLLVPLLWVSALATHGEAGRSLLIFLVGLFGATLLGGLQRHYFGPARASQPRDTAAFAAMWFLAGAFPALPWRPFELLWGALAVGAWCWWQGARPLARAEHNRRFEVRLLAIAAPLYGGYLALTILASLARGVGEWTFRLGFTDAASDQVEILRLLELIAAFTLLGYMIAEARGRAIARFREALPGVFACSLALVFACELVHGYSQTGGASLARGVLLVLAALYGGRLYYLQRAHVVHLLSPGSRNAPA